MMDFNKMSSIISRKFKKAQDVTIEDWENGLVYTEPAISESFVDKLRGEFKEFLKDYKELTDKVLLKVYSIGGGGKNTMETKYGADFSIILTLKPLVGDPIIKGLLMQAKNDGNGVEVKKISNRYKLEVPNIEENKKLLSQIDRMLKVTPQSYVLVCSKKSFLLALASEVKVKVGKENINCTTFPWDIRKFFKCDIGDHYVIESTDALFGFLRDNPEIRTEDELQSFSEKWAKFITWFDIYEEA